MCAALNQFFTLRHESEEAKLQRKPWALKKNIDLLFLRFYNCEPFEDWLRGKSHISPIHFSLIQSWNHHITLCC